MRENHPPEPTDALAFQALLYASGELNGTEAEAFERRLGEDQAARDALCQAVQMTQALTGQGPLRPTAAYRDAARQRLRQRSGVWQWLVGSRRYRGHPAVWSGLGAAAAALLLVVIGQAFPTSPPPTAAEPTQVVVENNLPPPATTPTIEMAKLWADLHNSDHLERAHSDEARRKTRLARGEEVRRFSGSPIMRN